MNIKQVNIDWPAPGNIHAVSTLRTGGISKAPYNSFNLASHVGDDQLSVIENRKRLRSFFNLSTEPVWLEQIHSNNVVCLDEEPLKLQADASYFDAMCAIKLRQTNADKKVLDFVKKYPNSTKKTKLF